MMNGTRVTHGSVNLMMRPGKGEWINNEVVFHGIPVPRIPIVPRCLSRYHRSSNTLVMVRDVRSFVNHATSRSRSQPPQPIRVRSTGGRDVSRETRSAIGASICHE